MATEQELMNALRKADAAGDTNAAKAIARAIQTQRSQPASGVNPEPPAQAATQPVAPAKERSWLDYGKMALRAAGQGVAGLNDQLQSVMNPGQAIMAKIAEQQGHKMPTQAELATASARKVGSALYGDVRPETSGEKLFSEAVRGAVPAALTAGGSLAVAGEQALSGGLAGTAGEYARQHNVGPVGQVAASLLAGGSPAAATGLWQAGRSALAHTKLSGASGAEEAAAAALNRSVYNRDEALKNLRNPPAPVQGTSPVTAELMRDPTFAALHRAHPQTEIQQQQYANALAMRNQVEQLGGAGDASAITKAAQAGVDKGTTAEQQALENVSPIVSEQASGEKLHTPFEARYAGQQGQTTASYNAPILKSETQYGVPRTVFSGLRKTVNEFFKEGGGVGGKTNKADPELQGIIKDIANRDTSVPRSDPMAFTTSPLRQVNIDQRLNAFKTRMSMEGQQGQLALAKKVQAHLDANIPGLFPPEHAQALRAAKDSRIAQDVIYESSKPGQVLGSELGRRVNDPQAVSQMLIQKGPEGAVNADQLIKAVGAAPTETAAREELRRLVEDGKLTPGTKDTWAASFRPLIDKFPNLRQHIDELHQVVKDNNMFRKGAFGSLFDPTESPTSAIRGMLNDPDSTKFSGFVKDVLNSGDQDAIDGVRRVIADHVSEASVSSRPKIDEAGQSIPDTDNLLVAIDRVMKHAQGILTPQQQEVLSQIRNQAGMTNFAGHSGVSVNEPNIGRMNLPLSGINSRALKFMWEQFGNAGKVDDLIKRALREPKFAEDLLARPTHARMNTFKRILRTSAIGTAVGTHTGTPDATGISP